MPLPPNCTVTRAFDGAALTCPCAGCVAGRRAHPWWPGRCHPGNLPPWVLHVTGFTPGRLAPAADLFDEALRVAVEVSQRRGPQSLSWEHADASIALLVLPATTGVMVVFDRFSPNELLSGGWAFEIRADELPAAPVPPVDLQAEADAEAVRVFGEGASALAVEEGGAWVGTVHPGAGSERKTPFVTGRPTRDEALVELTRRLRAMADWGAPC